MNAQDIKQAHVAEYRQVATRCYELKRELEANELRLAELRGIIATSEQFEQQADEGAE